MFISGTDPECFILDKDGKPVPAWRFFPDKANKVNVDPTEYPAAVRDKYGPFPKDNVTALHDGYALEFNTPASWCRGNLAGYMLKAIKGAKMRLPEGHTLCTMPAVKINPGDMDDAPPDCQIFGCDPSFNAYLKQETTVNLDAFSHRFRYAGGHMHLSVAESTKGKNNYPQWIFDSEEVMLFIRMMDLYVGLPLTVWFAKPETFQRRQYYGKAGEFRFQKYPNGEYSSTNQSIGVEYRTPGPELWNSPVVASFAFGAMRHLAEQFTVFKNKWDAGLEPDIQQAVNTGEGMETLVEKAYIPLSGSENRLEWFKRTIIEEKPFQTMLQDFDANSTVGHRGWDTYNMARDLGRGHDTMFDASLPVPTPAWAAPLWAERAR